MKLLLRFAGFLFAAGTIVFLVGIGATAGLIWHFPRICRIIRSCRITNRRWSPAFMPRMARWLPNTHAKRRLYLPIQAVPEARHQCVRRRRRQKFLGTRWHRFHAVSRAPVRFISKISAPTVARRVRRRLRSRSRRTFLLTNEVSFQRKIKEALLALKIERAYTKEKILEALS